MESETKRERWYEIVSGFCNLHPARSSDFCVMQSMAERIVELEGERDRMRKILVASVNSTDGGCSDTVSVEFLSHLPAEIAGIREQREKYRKAATVLCGAHIGVPQGECPVCERDRLRGFRQGAIEAAEAARANPDSMTFAGYAAEVDRTFDPNGDPMTYAAWLAEETGEAIGRARRCVRDLERNHDDNAQTQRIGLAEELGDVLWHTFALAMIFKIDPTDVARRNVAKLRARYPDGFTPDGGIR